VNSQIANFAAQYAEYSDGELLRLASEGGLREEAEFALRQELQKRQITPHEIRQEKLHRKRSELQRNVGSNPYDKFRGTGLIFRGTKYLPRQGKHKIAVKTRWLVISWMSIVPLGSYRIEEDDTDRGFAVLKKEKLQWDQVLTGWMQTGSVVILLGCAWLWLRWWAKHY
jgi:hypothetical protein